MENGDGSSAGDFKPPYNLAFRTFLNLLNRLQQEPVPPRIDRTYLSKLSGTDQTHLIGALRGFGLIDENNTVHPDLAKMAKDEAFRKDKLKSLLHTYYPNVVGLGAENATQGMLEEAIGEFGLTGDSRRKALTFYLKAAEFAGLPLSPHFRIPKDRAPRGTGGRAPRSSGTAAAQKKTPGTKRQSGGAVEEPRGESQTVTLASGGTVTLTVDVSLLHLSKDDYDWVWGLVEKFRGYPSVEGGGPDGEDDDQ